MQPDLNLSFAADHFWWTDEPLESATDFYHPNEYAPHCLPCHWTTQDEQRSMSRIDDYKPFTPYIGCPCTVEHICRNDKRNLYKKACNTPQQPLPFRSESCSNKNGTDSCQVNCAGYSFFAHVHHHKFQLRYNSRFAIKYGGASCSAFHKHAALSTVGRLWIGIRIYHLSQ